MPAHAEAKIKNNVIARSRTAKAERLKLCIRYFSLVPEVNDLSLVQEMRSKRDDLFTGFDSVGHDDFFPTDRGNLDGAELHFQVVVHDPDARSAADRKSTRLNSSHSQSSYAVFCLKKKMIATKLFRPGLRQQSVERKRLHDVLRQGLTLPLTLVVAPAGWGKSTLVADWLARYAVTAGWVSLESGANDPKRFWRYLLLAADQAGSAAGAVALRRLDAAGSDVLRDVLPAFVNELFFFDAPPATEIYTLSLHDALPI